MPHSFWPRCQPATGIFCSFRYFALPSAAFETSMIPKTSSSSTSCCAAVRLLAWFAWSSLLTSSIVRSPSSPELFASSIRAWIPCSTPGAKVCACGPLVIVMTPVLIVSPVIPSPSLQFAGSLIGLSLEKSVSGLPARRRDTCGPDAECESDRDQPDAETTTSHVPPLRVRSRRLTVREPSAPARLTQTSEGAVSVVAKPLDEERALDLAGRGRAWRSSTASTRRGCLNRARWGSQCARSDSSVGTAAPARRARRPR